MARLTQAQKHAASVIAHAIYASKIDREVEGMNGFEAHYSKTFSANDRALVKFFKEEMTRILQDFAQMLKEEERNGASS